MTRSATTPAEQAEAGDSALAPLRRGGFRGVWSGLAGSQLVIWMNTVGAVTVIAAVSDSSTLLALVQTANSLPAVLFALVAGTVADIVDRRRLALGAQLFMLAATAALAVLTFTDTATAAAVLGLTFVLGSGMATTFVVYQSLTPEMVPRGELPAAVALNGVGINLARAAGPALAGLLIAVLSAGALFSIEAALMAVVIVVVLRLRPQRRSSGGREQLAPAMRAGVRFVRFSWPVRTVLVVVAGAYFFSGLAKLLHAGPAWVASGNLRWVLYASSDSQPEPNPFALFVADRPVLAHLVAAATLAVELGFPLVLWRPRLAWLFVPAVVAMHAGIGLAMHLDYSAMAATVVVVMVDWPALADRLQPSPVNAEEPP